MSCEPIVRFNSEKAAGLLYAKGAVTVPARTWLVRLFSDCEPACGTYWIEDTCCNPPKVVRAEIEAIAGCKVYSCRARKLADQVEACQRCNACYRLLRGDDPSTAVPVLHHPTAGKAYEVVFASDEGWQAQ